jgi:hypothetical protein
MESTDEKKELIKTISDRRQQDERWSKSYFFWSQVLLWFAILASFGSAIASATKSVPSILVAIFAAIPGTIIVVERSFSFSHRASWHRIMRARLLMLENSLRYEGASIESVSKAFGELFLEMHPKYPGMSSEGLAGLASAARHRKSSNI